MTYTIGSGTTNEITVADASYFQDGWGAWSSGGPIIYPDQICVGTVNNCGQINSINYTTNVITMFGNIIWTDNNAIWLYRNSAGTRVLFGTGPDQGAKERDVGEPTISNPIPYGTQVCTGPTQQVTVGVSTDENATCKYDTVDHAYDVTSGVTFTTTGGTSHSGTTTIPSNASYTWYSMCVDESGNTNTAGTAITWTIGECGSTPVGPTESGNGSFTVRFDNAGGYTFTVQ